MAQTRYHNFQRPIDSFAENKRLNGMLAYGRYTGFNALANLSGMGCDIVHSPGATQLQSDNVTEDTDIGIWYTKQGVVVQESAGIAISFNANLSANPRIDIIYGEHDWLGSTGGQAAVYGVTQGTPATNPVAPALAVNQVELARVLIPGLAADLTGVTLTPAPTPLPGNADIIDNFPQLDARYARLAARNGFSARNDFSMMTGHALDTGDLSFGTNGNTIDMTGYAGQTIKRLPDIQNGAAVWLWNNPTSSFVTLSMSNAITSGSGYLKFRCSFWNSMTGLDYMALNPGDAVRVQQINNEWWITDYSNALSLAVIGLNQTVATMQAQVDALIPVPVGGIIMWSGVLTGFDATGKGNDPGTLKNWALCNGNNGTPDLRGRFIVGAVDINDTSAPALASEVDPATNIGVDNDNPPNYAMNDTGGVTHHAISEDEMPVHNHGLDAATGNGTTATAPLGRGDSGAGADFLATNVRDAGTGHAHINLPPYYAMAYLMRIS